MKIQWSVILGCIVLLTAAPLFSQQVGEEREKVKERIEMIRMWKMMDVLDLSREQSEKFLPALEEIENRRREIFQERVKTMKELRETVRGENPDESAVVDMMRRLEKNHDSLEALDKEERKEIADILTPVQQGRYIVFKENFERELRNIIRDVQGTPPKFPKRPFPQDRRRP